MYRKPAIRHDIPAAVAERAATRFVEDESGCHISTYSIASHGYAQIGWTTESGRITATTAHRAAWVHHTGEQIPEGMTVDHTCRTRPCVRRDHLRLLPNWDNACDNGRHSRVDPQEIPGKRCRQGHKMLLYVSGATGCRECGNERIYRKRARRKESR